MLLSVALIVLTALLCAKIAQKLMMPALVGMIGAGVILGPFVFDLIDGTILEVSPELRQIALVVILIRAGLTIDFEDFKKIGKSALFLSFIPATVEIIAIVIFAPLFFGISLIDAMILGTVLAAVSPAVVVPRMIKLIDQGYGHDKRVPHLVLASASVDDVYVLVLFASFLRLGQGDTLSFSGVAAIPVAVIFGVFLGLFVGEVFVRFVKHVHLRDTVKVLIILSVGLLFVVLEEALHGVVPISGLIAVIAFAAMLLKRHDVMAKRLVRKFEKIWVVAEIALFVLVGAVLDLKAALLIGLMAVVFVILMLIFRSFGVLIALLGSGLDKREKRFVVMAYLPKATVQAAIGAVPLAYGIESGQLILTLAVLSILLTAPLGAALVDWYGPRLLKMG
ncbi:MAG: cation:proton antiporter [Acholeplasmataceae bacterium]|nr:cation:proton antiporter [Acholeplasmataceae bacterium]